MYQANCDGYVIYSLNSNHTDNTYTFVNLYYGDTNNPANSLLNIGLRRANGFYIDERQAGSVPIPKGKYRKISTTGSTLAEVKIVRLPTGNCD